MSFAEFTRAVLLLFAGIAAVPSGWTQTYAPNDMVLHAFCVAPGACPDGANPQAGLIRDASGNLYGTTLGTVFKVDNAGHLTVLYTFCSAANCTDGSLSFAGLIQDAAGNLYGTTASGGANNGGTVFKVDNTGHETVLYSFCSAAYCTDGQDPSAGLIQDAAGNFYGTTYYGGAGSFFGGTVFKLDTTGHETVLYNFCSVGKNPCLDGAQPSSSLIQDAAGNLYGTTTIGGNSKSCQQGCGTAFKLDTTGHETVLYNFCSATPCTGGGFPSSGLIQDAASNFYGTTSYGGSGYNGGTVFKLDSAGQETVLYSFCASNGLCKDGRSPSGSLIQDAAGNLYGTTVNDGLHLGGTVFKLDSAGYHTVLHNFCYVRNCADGRSPSGGVIQDAVGNLYGTTAKGGSGSGYNSGYGTVFELIAELGISLTSSSNPSYVSQPVTFSVVISSTGVTPTGSVTFKAGTTVLGTVTLDNGQASLTTTFSKRENVPIVASYSGDQNYKAANSKPLPQVVQRYATSTALASSLNPSNHGQAVTFAATVSSAGPTPSGFVIFKNGSAWLGKASLSGNVAKITTSTLPVGTSPITALYDGDAANATSASPILSQVVN